MFQCAVGISCGGSTEDYNFTRDIPEDPMDVEHTKLEDMSGWWDPDELEECPACGERKLMPSACGGSTRMCLACGEFQHAKPSS